MKNTLVIFILILFSLLTSCITTKPENSMNLKDNTENEILVTLRENTLQEYDSIHLINSADEYYTITNQINSIRMPGIDFKKVDFNTKSVILINMLTDNYSDFTIFSKTNPESITIIYSGIHYEKNQIQLNHLRLIKLIELPKSKKIESFRPMH